MQCLELHVQQARLDEGGQAGSIFVHEAFKCVEAGAELVDGRRHEQGIAWTRAANPVLRAPELAGALGAAASALQQPAMHLADQAQ